MNKELEALKCCDNLIKCFKTDKLGSAKMRIAELNTIKQALLKAQKQEKVLEILKPLCEVVETPVKKYRYLKLNGVVVYTFKSEEEFNLLKEVV